MTRQSPLQPSGEHPIAGVVYQTVSISELPANPRANREISSPLNVLDKPNRSAHFANSALEGVLLTHEQGWRMRGLAIGRLVQSVALAPGEVTQLATSTWVRNTDGSASQLDQTDETASDSAGRDRGTSGITTAVAGELQTGGSSSSSAAAQSSAGGSFIFASGSTSTNSSVARTANFSTGARDISADSNQRVREATQQQASNTRGSRATLVNEVASSDTERFSTRVVANYNHMHTLNILYFEVLQDFELRTEVVDAQRCLFIPMDVIDFDASTLAQYAQPLSRAASAMGLTSLSLAIDASQASGPLGFLLAQRTAELKICTETLPDLSSKVAKLQQALDDEHAATEDARTAVDVLRSSSSEVTPTLPQALRLLDQCARAEASVRDEVDDARAKVEAATEDLFAAQAAWDSAQLAVQCAEADILVQLRHDQLAFNQALWLQIEPAQLAVMLAGRTRGGSSLVTTIDPNPVAVIGCHLGFRWAFTPDQQSEEAEFHRRWVNDDTSDSDAVLDSITVPTGGLFAEAVLGGANSAEKLDLTRFWHWDETTIPLLPTAISKLQQRARAPRGEARPTAMGASPLSLTQLPDAPGAPTSLAAAIGHSMFRDISGSEVVESLAEASQAAAASGSEDAQKNAQDSMDAYLGHIESMLPKVSSLMGGQSNALSPSTKGALDNTVGGGESLDAGELMSTVAELGVL